jgi:hypothetical protein
VNQFYAICFILILHSPFLAPAAGFSCRDEVKSSDLETFRADLGLDSINYKYLEVLFNAYKASKESKSAESSSVLLIADRSDLDANRINSNMVVPTAVASSQLMRTIPVTQYSHVKSQKENYEVHSKKTRFWVKKLMAGTGSGIVRIEFLKEIYSRLGKKGPIKIGSKGTDLHAEVEINGQVHLLSIAELQILQLLVQSDQFKQVIFHDVVSNETVDSISATWNRHDQLFGGKSLLQLATEKGESRTQPTVQFHIPTVGPDGKLTKERTAPAGHGLFAIEAIDAALQNKLPKSDKEDSLIGVIGNGEDLMSTPSADIVGWMSKDKSPIVMVTTEKTDLDRQGGQIAIGFNSKGLGYVTIVEKAQAESASKNGYPDQLDLFFKLGLRPGDEKAMFNTNMVLLNFKVLQPKLRQLADRVGGNDKLLALIAPDLIKNPKKQTDANGNSKVFEQLEGAMGSVILKLDRVYRENFNGEPLVHFLNIGKEDRTQFFAPIKSAFDFFMQFYSDRFKVDALAFKIVDQRPGSIPKVTLNDDFYKEAANVLKAFKDTKIIGLDELQIDGVVTVSGLELVGTVKVINKSGLPVNLTTTLQNLNFQSNRLKEVSIEIDSNGQVAIRGLKL